MTSAKISVGIVGITGYAGLELMSILSLHPHFKLSFVASRAEEGKKLHEIFPFMQGTSCENLTISYPNAKNIIDNCQLVFLAVPHSTAIPLVKELSGHNIKIVDLSADFRIDDAKTYEQWYNTEHTAPELLKNAVYGLVELYKNSIAKTNLVANPGCYPTASILALAPALQHKIIKTDSIIIDAKSGTSGAGRNAKISSLFCEVHDNFKPYSLTSHRHTPEIEQELSKIAQENITISFNTHLLPISRGILCTCYSSLKDIYTSKEVHTIYEKYYENDPLIRILPLGNFPETRFVKGSMLCDISISVDKRTNKLIICSAIDNLCRGAAGQAIANANLLFNYPVDTALAYKPLIP